MHLMHLMHLVHLVHLMHLMHLTAGNRQGPPGAAGSRQRGRWEPPGGAARKAAWSRQVGGRGAGNGWALPGAVASRGSLQRGA